MRRSVVIDLFLQEQQQVADAFQVKNESINVDEAWLSRKPQDQQRVGDATAKERISTNTKSISLNLSFGVGKLGRQRTQIEKRIEAALLFENDHTCCICMERGKHVQIHHIDEDNSNNTPGNLAVLCLDCHSRVTGTSGLGKQYSEFEVKKYKTHWEYVVRKIRKLDTRFNTTQPFKRREKEAFRFEIKKNVYMLVAAQNLSRAKEILEFLDTYSTQEGDAPYIFRQLIDVVPYLPNADLVATYVPQLLALRGPRDEDVKELKLAIELLRWIAMIGVLGMGFGQIQASLRALDDVSERAKTYKPRALTSLIARNLEELQMLLREDAEFLSATQKWKARKLIDLYMAKITKPISHTKK